MKKFTVHMNGEEIASGLSIEQAADEILSYDGYAYEIRRVEGGFQLYTSQRSRNSYGGQGKMVETFANNALLFVTDAKAANKDAAWKILVEEIIQHDWPNSPEATLDNEWKK